MHTQIASKLTALAAALMLNSMLMAGVAYLFDGQCPQRSSVMELAQAAAQPAHEAA
jgi:hypothetical protein